MDGRTDIEDHEVAYCACAIVRRRVWLVSSKYSVATASECFSVLL